MGACATMHVANHDVRIDSSQYPRARVTDANYTLHGQVVRDPYQWLEDASLQETTAWVAAENTLAERYLKRLPRRAPLAERIVQLGGMYLSAVPRLVAGRTFIINTPSGKDKTALRVRMKDGRSLSVFDPNGSGNLVLRNMWPAPDGKHVAIVVSENNADDGEIRIFRIDERDATALEAIDDIFDSGDMPITWAPTGSGFYYRYTPEKPGVAPPDRSALSEIRFHKIGTPPQSDAVIRGAVGKPDIWEHIDISQDGRWLVAVRYVGAIHTDLLVQDTKLAPGTWVDITAGKDASYDTHVSGHTLFILTNDGAPNFRLMAVDLNASLAAPWREVVSERKDRVIENFVATRSRLLLVTSQDAIDRIDNIAHDGTDSRLIPLPAMGSVYGIYGSGADDEVTYAYSSLIEPHQAFALDAKSGQQERLQVREDAALDSSRFIIEQTFTVSKDGTRFPMFIARPRTAHATGDNPTLLNAYGGLGISQKSRFIPRVYAWLEQGGTFVLANVRGGNEYGDAWRLAGMGRKRQNVFDDFIAAATTLIDRKWTSPPKLAIYGGSNGGMLVAAAETQRPDLFAAVLCASPLTDMIRSPLFGIGKAWVSEDGDPQNPDDFRALFAYSPYHHVRKGVRYPATLITTADSDDRVDPMHARKFAAALQAASTGGPVLLRVEQSAGHSGSGSVKDRAEIDAEMLAFALEQMR